MFKLSSQTKWYWPQESDFIVPRPSPLELPGLLTPPPTSLEFPIPSVVGVWIFSGTCTHCLKIYILLHVLNKNKNIVNAGYWVLIENPRNFGCNISIRPPSIQSLGGGGGKVIRCQLVGGWNMLYFLGGKSCKKWRSHFCQVQKIVYFTNFFSSIS